MYYRTGAAVAGLLMANGAAATVKPIVAKGQHFFFANNGSQFFVRGVAYQQGVGLGATTEPGATFTDTLADGPACKRDIPFLQQLGTNVVRVYAVDPNKDHTECMHALEDAGIHVLADLSVPGQSIERDNPAWNTDLYARYTAVIDNLARFPNALGFFAGNEVTNDVTNTQASAFVKAAVRDTKAFIAAKSYDRWLGVGYATNDDAATRDNLAGYFNCGNRSTSVDFWGYNIYEWCGQSTFEASGYQERTQAFQNYSVPAFFSEYGCNNPGGGAVRKFQETAALYGDQMNQVWSGGIVYEYFQEQNDFGLVDARGDTVTPRGGFDALAGQIARAGYPTTATRMASYVPANTARDCPPIQRGWKAAEALPPTPDAAACDDMFASLSCIPTDRVKPSDIGTLFGTVCGMDPKACTGIASNATTGVYGAFVMCNSTQQLAHVLDRYYVSQGKKKTACDFSGLAKVVTPTRSGTSSGSSSSGGGSSSSGGGSSSGASSTGATSAVRIGTCLAACVAASLACILL